MSQFSDDDEDDRGKSLSQRNRGGYDSPLASYRSDAGKPPSGRLPTMSRENNKIGDNKKPLALTYPHSSSNNGNRNLNDSDDSYTDSRFSKKANTSNSSYDKSYESKYDR